MNKDKEWLKEEKAKIIQKEIANISFFGSIQMNNRINDLIDQLEQPKKPVVPQFVAKHLELAKEEITFERCMEITVKKLERMKYNEEYNWIRENLEAFFTAWKYGYEVEKEKMYTVCFEDKKNVWRTGIFLYKEDGCVRSGNAMGSYDKKDSESHLTEKEIKDYDERFWQFAEPVEEVTE